MSASERLKKLNEAIRAADEEALFEINPEPKMLDARLPLDAALPLIADVVEAAEKTLASGVIWPEMDAALTALRDGLEKP